MRQVACDLLESAKEPDFEKMIPELVDWVVTAWYDHEPDRDQGHGGGQARGGGQASPGLVASEPARKARQASRATAV